MAHDVFISYSSRDRSVAYAACAAVESNRIRCWIAPCDVLPGLLSAEALIEAINGSRTMLLVFSSGANSSPHRLDALTPPLEEHLHHLAGGRQVTDCRGGGAQTRMSGRH
jgi:hypothetical protein